MIRAARWGVVVLGFFAAIGLSAPAALAFDISPPSGSVQAGDDMSGIALSGLPVTADGGATCLETSGGTSVYLVAIFSPACGGQQGWSSTMTIRTIPATAAGTYQIVIDVCPVPGCAMTAGVRNAKPIASVTWTLRVSAAPVPVTMVSETPTPAPGTPAPTRQAGPTPGRTPAASSPSPVQPSRRAPPTPAAVASSGAPTPSPNGSASAGPLGLGARLQLVLSRPGAAPGSTVGVSGHGCAPGSEVTVGVAERVTGTATADGEGAFRVELRLPASLRAGRYEVVGRCGVTASTLLDVQAGGRGMLAGAVIVVALVVSLAVGMVLGRLARRPRS